MTREEIRNRILYQLDESTSAPAFYTAAEIDTLIDEAQEVLAEEAHGLVRTSFLPKSDGLQLVSLQALGDDVMAPLRIWDDNHRRLEYCGMQELDADRWRWWEVTSDFPWLWYPVAWNVLGIYPAIAAGTGTLRVDYLAWPTALADDSQEPDMPEPEHDQLVLYGVYMGLLKRWDIVRALDVFQKFVGRWPDSMFRDDVARLAAGIEGRSGTGDMIRSR